MLLKVIAEIYSPDRFRAVRILERSDGLFQWREDLIPTDEEIGLFWRDGPLSEMFGTLAEARAAVFQDMFWTHDGSAS